MKYLEDLVSHLIETARRDEQEKQRKDKPLSLNTFKVEMFVKQLVSPAQRCAAHHRSREGFYVKELEQAEIILREKGISTEVVDARTGQAVFQGGGPGMATVCSGSVAFGNYGSEAPRFQARADPVLLGNVERAKNKMLEHGKKAEQYEKYARAFACAPSEARIELSIDDIHYFRLEK